MQDNEQLRRFIVDPHFPILEDYFRSFFEEMLDIKNINVDKTSEAVHAELIAFQKVSEAFDTFKTDVANVKLIGDRKPTSFK